MDWVDDLTCLEIDISSYCNAACPSCARTQTIDQVELTHFNLDTWKRLWTEDLKNYKIKKLVLNGNWGDPMMHKDLLEMIKYPAQHNPDIKVFIDTNGGMRSTKFWHDVGTGFSKLYNFPVMVRFGIDGITNFTNQIYRVDVDYNKVIENAQAFIQGGGLATWNMTVFDHNIHQVSRAYTQAKKLGFVAFRSRKSYARNILDKDDNIRATTFCYDNVDHKKTFYIKRIVDNYQKFLNRYDNSKFLGKKTIVEYDFKDHKCIWYREKRLQIDPYSNVWPCCHLSGEIYTIEGFSRLDVFKDSWQKYGYKVNNINKKTLTEVLQSKYFTFEIDNAVKNARWEPCTHYCGVDRE